MAVSAWRDVARLATLTGRTRQELARRLRDGHSAFVATFDGVPAAYGWVASRTASLGELGITLQLPSDERYLWNFVTLPEFRGRGIYPRLLEAIIVRLTRRGAQRLWIAYAPENHASALGIMRAGFTHVADLSFDPAGRVAFRAQDAAAAPLVAKLLGVEAASGPLAPCWRCERAGRGVMACAEGECSCDYQVPRSGCASIHLGGERSSGSGSSNGAGIS
jgi:ribosomal protein S18 acetylase RimI-like enzyme